MRRITSLIMAALIFISFTAAVGCSGKTPSDIETAAPSAEPTAQPTSEPTSEPTAEPTAEPTPEPTPEPPLYEFDPHVHVSILDPEIPQEYWDSFHNLCDALRVGETTFECASEAAYKWATDATTLTELFPAACTKVKGVSNDGTTPYENGVGRIYYQMPIDEYLERQAQFEAAVVDVLNTYLEPDDDDFEKCLKLYDYMESNYTYDYGPQDHMSDGANYRTFMNHTGQCIELGSVYAYLLLQAGVQAMQIGCYSEYMDHAWTYIVLNGKGYHADATWSLKSSNDTEELLLYYFLMDDERRTESGLVVDDLTAPLLPRFWAKFASVDFTCDSKEYCVPSYSYLEWLDEENKLVHYDCWGEKCEYSYAHD